MSSSKRESKNWIWVSNTYFRVFIQKNMKKSIEQFVFTICSDKANRLKGDISTYTH